MLVADNIIFRLKVFEDTDKSSKDHPTVVEQRAFCIRANFALNNCRASGGLL